MRKPLLLGSEYFPSHEENRMINEGDLESAREFFLSRRPNNLFFLLRSRFEWMNEYVDGKEVALEVGAGAGFSREFVSNPNYQLTDLRKFDWIDEEIDALDLPFGDGTVDAIVSSHMIHHLATPAKFFNEITRVLKPGGYLVIQEINTSLLTRMILRIMRHEGWSYDVDVFDEEVIANDPCDPWSANCAIPQMLFSDPQRFESRFSRLKVVKNERCECLILALSGGVIAKTRTVRLPMALLDLVHFVDKVAIAILPQVFAMGRRVVVQKT